MPNFNSPFSEPLFDILHIGLFVLGLFLNGNGDVVKRTLRPKSDNEYEISNYEEIQRIGRWMKRTGCFLMLYSVYYGFAA